MLGYPGVAADAATLKAAAANAGYEVGRRASTDDADTER
jgi:hypothetical protein